MSNSSSHRQPNAVGVNSVFVKASLESESNLASDGSQKRRITLFLFVLLPGVRPHGPPQRFHDPHAPRSQLRHFQVPLQLELPQLSEHPEGRVPPGPVQEVRLSCPQVPHCPEEHLTAEFPRIRQPLSSRSSRSSDVRRRSAADHAGIRRKALRPLGTLVGSRVLDLQSTQRRNWTDRSDGRFPERTPLGLRYHIPTTCSDNQGFFQKTKCPLVCGRY